MIVGLGRGGGDKMVEALGRCVSDGDGAGLEGSGKVKETGGLTFNLTECFINKKWVMGWWMFGHGRFRYWICVCRFSVVG